MIPTNDDYARSTSPRRCRRGYEFRVAAAGDTVGTAAICARDADEIGSPRTARGCLAMRFLDPQRPKRLPPRLRRCSRAPGSSARRSTSARGILARIDQLIR
jgi:hypothetical protein